MLRESVCIETQNSIFCLSVAQLKYVMRLLSLQLKQKSKTNIHHRNELRLIKLKLQATEAI